MRIVIGFLLVVISCSFSHAQFSRLHVKPANASVVGITTGASVKVVGISHDGTAGVISTTTLTGASDYSPLKFATAGETRLTIFENGFVGIGVTGTPSAQLTVAGKVHAREVKVNISAGTAPDFVFQDSYKLLSLKDISRYINQHGHLPEVPAAVEMETNGVNLSEMNMLLLKKVEELTLLMIEQDKKVDDLSTRLQAQKEELEKLKEKK